MGPDVSWEVTPSITLHRTERLLRRRSSLRAAAQWLRVAMDGGVICARTLLPIYGSIRVESVHEKLPGRDFGLAHF